MIQLRRNLGLLLSLTAFVAPVQADELQDAFNRGVELLASGDKEGALAQFQAALAADPSNDEAYQLWTNTEHQVWYEMLIEGGEFELIAKRLMERVRTGKVERSDDAASINELVRVLENNEDALERHRAVRELSAKHGEYAVPRMLNMLSKQDGSETSVIGVVSLAQMDASVVLPLIEALQSDDSFLQMNIAHTLGRIGDPRAAGALAELAAGSGETVAQAAVSAAEKCGAKGRPAAELYLEEGHLYYTRSDLFLRPYDRSDVVWSWSDGQLQPSPVPSAIYAETLAKRSFTRALSSDPQSLAALAGLARSASSIETKLTALPDVDEALLESAAQGNLAVCVAGAEALDVALGDALAQSPQDVVAGVGLARNLAYLATSPMDSLTQAASMGEGPLRAEASIALAHVAAESGADPGGAVIDNLATAASREVVRIVVVIDGNAERAATLEAGFQDQSVTLLRKDRAAAGLALLRQIPGVDAILVGDGLADLTLDQVVEEISSMQHISQSALFIVSASDANEGYADRERVNGVIDGSDLSEVLSVLEQDLSGDRAEANDLGRRAAEALAHVAARGGDIGGALDALANVAQEREADEVTLPAMRALGLGGSAGQVHALVAVLSNEARSDEARVAAAQALTAIFGRESVQASDAAGLREVVVGSGPLAVRQAAARALGRAQVGPAERASIVEEVGAAGAAVDQ